MKFANIKTLVAGSAFAALALGASAAQAASTSTASATASATIIAPATLTNTGGLAFGTIVSSTVAGTDLITATSSVTQNCTGGITCLSANTPTAASFTVAGVSGNIVGLTVPATVTLTGPGSNTMTVTPSLSSATVTLGAAATTFYVGGSLAVNASQASGAYTGSVVVTAQYQ